MKVNNSRITAVLLISFSLIYNGCATIIGYGIGTIVDNERPDRETVNRDDYMTIELDEEITIYQKDKSVKIGKLNEITEKYLSLETVFGLEKVNMEDILFLEVKLKKNGKWKGLKIGIMLDIANVLFNILFPQGYISL